MTFFLLEETSSFLAMLILLRTCQKMKIRVIKVDGRHLFLVGLGATTTAFFPFLVEEEEGRVTLESDSLGESGFVAFL